MIFKKLVLKNFKSHKNTVVDFSQGINIIVGENGAGKSTILEGISFALFKQHTSKKIDSLVMNNADSMEVSLEFDTNYGTYKIVREKKSNLKSSLFKKEGDNFIHICSGDKEVLNQMENILQIDSDLFLNAIYVRQGEIAELVNKTAADKKQLISKLLGLDSLEIVWKNLLPYINDYNNQSMELKGRLYNSSQIAIEFEQERSNILSLYSDCQECVTYRNRLTEEMEDLTKQKHKLDAVKNNIDKIESRINAQKHLLSKSKVDLQNIQENLDKIDNAEQQIIDLEGCIDDLHYWEEKEKDVLLMMQIKSERDNLDDDLRKKKDKIKSFCKKVSTILGREYTKLYDVDYDLQHEVEILRYNRSDILDAIDQNKEEQIKVEQKITSLQKSLKDVNDVDGVCPICQSVISDDKKNELVKQYTDDIDDYSMKLDDLTTAMIEIQETFSECDHKLDVLLKLQMELISITELKIELDESQIKLNELNERVYTFDFIKIEDIRGNIISCKKSVDRYNQLLGFINTKEESLKKLNDIQENIESSEHFIKNWDKEIQDMNYDNQEHQNICDILSDKEEEYYTVQTHIAQIKGEAEKTISRLKELSDEKRDLSIVAHEYKVMLDYIDILMRLRDIYGKNGLQQELRSMSKPLIESKTKALFNNFNFNYSDLYLDDDYEVYLCGPEGESTTHMVSGGEKIAIALALRLGITQAISKEGFDTILLDEPTIHLDDTRKYELLDLFRNIAVVPQMIIVTHEHQLENIADNFITVTKNNGISTVVE